MANSSLKRSQDALQVDTSVSYQLQISSTRNYYLHITKDVSDTYRCRTRIGVGHQYFGIFGVLGLPSIIVINLFFILYGIKALLCV